MFLLKKTKQKNRFIFKFNEKKKFFSFLILKQKLTSPKKSNNSNNFKNPKFQIS